MLKPDGQEPVMSLRINDIAPDFSAHTTHGKINFHESIGDSQTAHRFQYRWRRTFPYG